MSNQIIPNENESSKKEKSDFTLIDNDSSLNENEDKYTHGRWTYEEHMSFIDGVLEFSTNWTKLAQIIKSRSVVQIKSHARKYIRRLMNKYSMNSIVSNDIRINKSYSKEDMLKLSKCN